MGHPELPYITQPEEGKWGLGLTIIEQAPADEPIHGEPAKAGFTPEIGRWWPLGHRMDLQTRLSGGYAGGAILASLRRALWESADSMLGITLQTQAVRLTDIRGSVGPIHNGDANGAEAGIGMFYGFLHEDVPRRAPQAPGFGRIWEPDGMSLALRLLQGRFWATSGLWEGQHVDRTALDFSVAYWLRSPRGRLHGWDFGAMVPVDGRQPRQDTVGAPEKPPVYGFRLGYTWVR